MDELEYDIDASVENHPVDEGDSSSRRSFLRLGIKTAVALVCVSVLPEELVGRGSSWVDQKQDELWKVSDSLAADANFFLSKTVKQWRGEVSRVRNDKSEDLSEAVEVFTRLLQELTTDYCGKVTGLKWQYAALLENHRGRSYDADSNETVKSIIDEYKAITSVDENSFEENMEYLVKLAESYFKAVVKGFEAEHCSVEHVHNEDGSFVMDDKGAPVLRESNSKSLTLPSLSDYHLIRIESGVWYKIPFDRAEGSGPFFHIESTVPFVLKASTDGEIHTATKRHGLYHFRDLDDSDIKFLSIFIPGDEGRNHKEGKHPVRFRTEKRRIAY